MEHNYRLIPLKNIYGSEVRKKLAPTLSYNEIIKRYHLFFEGIDRYYKVIKNTYISLVDTDSDYFNFISLVRLLSDAVYTVYGLFLADNPDNYIDSYLEDKPLNRIKYNGENLTTNVIGNYIKNDYPGMDIIYKEGCSFIHPSRLFLEVKFHNRKILTEKSIWKYHKKISGNLARELRRDFFMVTLSEILGDIIILTYNKQLATRFNELDLIDHKSIKKILRLTRDNYNAYIDYRLSNDKAEEYERYKIMRKKFLRDKNKPERD